MAQPQPARSELGTPEILHQLALTHGKTLPRDLLAAASQRRDEMIPLFIDAIEAFLAAGPERAQRETPLFFAFHLLGEWRATPAYRPLARLLRVPSDDLDAALGDAITETIDRVMAAVFDGDTNPLHDIILDAEADEFCRSRMFRALLILVREGRLGREYVEAFVRDCTTRLLPREDCYVWFGWMEIIAHLGMADMRAAVQRAFDDNLVDPLMANHQWFERELQASLANPDRPDLHSDYSLFGDTIEELSSWFRVARMDGLRRVQDSMSTTSWDAERLLPKVNHFAKVGRNDPCPCGSGKKFKKCCLSA